MAAVLYYERHYDPEHERHVLHGDWMVIFEMLSSEEFMDQVQDYLFIEKRMPNRQVNEYLAYCRRIVCGFHKKIENLLEDLKDCGSKEDYQEAMQWSRQFAAQQAKAEQKELEEQYGPEKAKEILEQAMEAAEE
jgi:hypothetical protein